MSTDIAIKKNISERILDSFPGGTYMMGTLLRLLDIVETDRVETAAVECRIQPRMLINPGFVRQWADTPERLMMLVMHELHHIILGHTRLLRRITRLDNLVFDAVINSLLCRMFPEPAYTSLFTRFYRHDRFPECFLRPCPQTPSALVGSGTKSDMKKAAQVYRALYSPRGVTYDELYDILSRSVTELEADSVVLLGDHPQSTGSADGHLEERAPVLLDVVRGIVEQWPQPPDPLRGRSLNDLMNEDALRPVRQRSNRERLRRLLRRVGGVRGGHAAHQVTEQASWNILTPIPASDRRSIVLRAMGVPALLHQATLTTTRRRRGGERVHVYLDVSGSIGNLKAALYGAVLDCRNFVHPSVHLFSTQVVDVSLSGLVSGVCKTTDGTDIACVADHIARHRIRRAALITDGYVGNPAGLHRSTLQKTRLGVALTPGYSTREDLEEVADHWNQLQDLNQQET